MCNDFCAIYAEEALWEAGELLERGVEKPHTAAKRSALDMVIRGGELDESLKEAAKVPFRLEPESLPGLVRVPELMAVEEGDAGGER